MTANAKHPAVATTSPVVLFGIDSHGKPKAARFGKEPRQSSNQSCDPVAASSSGQQ